MLSIRFFNQDQTIAKVQTTTTVVELTEFHGAQMVQELLRRMEPMTKVCTFGSLI